MVRAIVRMKKDVKEWKEKQKIEQLILNKIKEQKMLMAQGRSILTGH